MYRLLSVINLKLSHTPSSKRFLFILFIVALPIFIFLRWDSSTWLSAQVQQAASEQGYHLNYDSVNLSGLGLYFKNIQVSQISQPNVPPIECEQLGVSLSISNLFSGALAADIDALWETNPISFTAAQQNEFIDITNIEALIDVSRLDKYTANLMAKVSGLVSVQGALSIDPNKQLLHSAHLNSSWAQAMAGLSQPEFTLGDYHFELNSLEDINQPWQWAIKGGSGLGLHGSGTLSPFNPDPQFWHFSGNIDLQADNTNPTLAAMLQAYAGSNQAKVRLTGTFSNPRMDIIR